MFMAKIFNDDETRKALGVDGKTLIGCTASVLDYLFMGETRDVAVKTSHTCIVFF